MLHKINSKKFKGLFLNVRGLIGRKPEPFFLQTRWGIHTFFLKFPIDVIIMDKEYRVVKIKEKISPNNIFFWNPLYNNVMELPNGFILKKGISLFDKINIIYSE
ncbi:hypothetical protein LBMAG33_0800 [Candidatus Levyibacteriota bacterium]|nr:DUF192 domain-containing protein [Candidatus Levybacteria bacterium]MSU26250.1 hypothetical protein [Candidatus Levybacteria bacterium]GDX61770.1 hypothetical protein LBMAG33_0800 [Candidatus Levybacteria bacterium]